MAGGGLAIDVNNAANQIKQKYRRRDASCRIWHTIDVFSQTIDIMDGWRTEDDATQYFVILRPFAARVLDRTRPLVRNAVPGDGIGKDFLRRTKVPCPMQEYRGDTLLRSSRQGLEPPVATARCSQTDSPLGGNK